MPYCRRCGNQLWENARFCHKCGTPAVMFTPPPSAKPASKRLLSNPEIVLIAVAAAIIVVASVFVLATFYSVNVNQARSSNQTTFNTFSFKIQEGTPTYVSFAKLLWKTPVLEPYWQPNELELLPN
ncbi:MAG TPA: zinc ribbon domain-containing protein [Candidatus Bathyarchaeia archaeon]|nr:zinc ribbon domain-containing protein [Candidatus Bathyarchaeia archaeon]